MPRSRVLLVDDDGNIRRAVGRVLASRYTVHVAEDGEVALQLLDEIAFDAVIADHDMPGLSGIDVLEHVHRHDARVLRILMSGRDAGRFRAHLASGVVHVFLRKPIGAHDLVECLLQRLQP